MQLIVNGDTIEKKEYLGRGDLVKVELPPQVKTIENWAFAQCVNLREIAIPSGLEHLGKDVFQDCGRLERIIIYDCGDVDALDKNDDRRQVLAGLTAAAFLTLDDIVLRQLSEVGTKEWLNNWDKACIEYIMKPDNAGFSPFLAGGEEDYVDKENNPEYYCHRIRRKKVDMVLMRLLAERYFSMDAEVRSEYVAYLSSLTGGVEENSNCEALEALMECQNNVAECFKIYDTAELLDADVVDRLLDDTDDSNIELKALLLRKKGSMINEKDTWEAFEL